jgi:hypothetical protein
MQLSKSEYMMFLKHPAWLWLKKNQKHVLPPPDAALQALFDAGHNYERYAEQLFPDGVRLGFNNYGEYQTLPERTRAALAQGANTIFQGRFEHGRTTCIVDVLQRVEDDVFDLYEIKASTSVKADHIPDLAFQVSVLEGAGIKMRHAGIVHVDRDYVRRGNIDAQQLSKIEDVTDRVTERIAATQREIEQALEFMRLVAMPDLSPRQVASGAMAEWMEIYRNVMGEPAKHSIYNLAGIKPNQVASFEDAGILTIDMISDDAELTERQARQVSVTRSGERSIDRAKVQGFLSGLSYPLYFLDYETFSDVIPPFEGLRPYQQVPFQYSLHIIPEPGAPVMHRECLHEEKSNPVQSLLSQMRDDIGDDGSVLVWYEAFEKGRNRDMALMSPEDAPFLDALNERVVDLMVPFQSGWYVDKDFMGSASFKKVLPVLAPDLSYDGLPIANGEVAQRAWMDIFIRGKSQMDQDVVLEDLRRYCALDTLAMVRIFEELRNI